MKKLKKMEFSIKKTFILMTSLFEKLKKRKEAVVQKNRLKVYSNIAMQ
jgi:hypothetical protein